MKYELRAESDDILRSVHYFPNDEAVSPRDYEVCAQQRYLANVAIVASAAERFGVDIDTETLERWKRGNMLSNLLDSFLDESPNRELAHDQYMRGLSFFRGDIDCLLPEDLDGVDRSLITAIILMDNSMDGVSDEHRSSLFNTAQTLGLLSAKKAACEDIDEYINLVTQEGDLCAGLLIDTVSDNVRYQSGFSVYSTWIVNALRVGILRDAMRDLEDDRLAGLTKVENGLLNKMKFVTEAQKPFRSMIKKSPERTASLIGLVAYRRFDQTGKK